MTRTIVLIAMNVMVAIVMAASIMPVAIILAPVVRETPAAGYAVFAGAGAVFAGMNFILWRWWKKR